MDKKNYDGQLRRQCLSIPAMAEEQIAGLKKGLENTIPRDVLKKIRRVILTGCGDSYLAAKIAVPAFEKYAGAFGNKFTFERCIDVAKAFKCDRSQAESTLVVAISASGSAVRVSEALLRARHYGAKSLLLTNAPESSGAKAAEYTFIVNTPPFGEPGPGLRNYYASLAGAFALAAYMGEAKGLQPEGTVDKLFAAILEYTAEFAKYLPEMDDQAFQIAQAWQNMPAMEAIGDYTDWASAYFIAAKVVEVAGVLATTIDSENWCHVHYFASDRRNIGTVIVSTKEFNNFSRVKETLRTVEGIGRPAWLITTGTREDYEVGAGVEVCTVPKAPEGFEFIEPMLNHIPGSIMASYLAALHGEPYFRAADSIHRTSPYGHTLRTSAIESF